jgi:hypothetical protein
VSAPVHAPSCTPLLLPLLLSHNNHPPRVQRSVYYQRKRDLFTLNKASAHSDVITVRCNFAQLTFHGVKRNKAAQDFGRVRTPKERVKRAGLRHAPAENCGAASREHGASQTDLHWRRRREQWPAAAISSTEVAGGGEGEEANPKEMPARQTQDKVHRMRGRLHLRTQAAEGQVQGMRGRLHLRTQTTEEHMQGMRGHLRLLTQTTEEPVQGMRGRLHLRTQTTEEPVHRMQGRLHLRTQATEEQVRRMRGCLHLRTQTTEEPVHQMRGCLHLREHPKQEPLQGLRGLHPQGNNR